MAGDFGKIQFSDLFDLARPGRDIKTFQGLGVVRIDPLVANARILTALVFRFEGGDLAQ